MSNTTETTPAPSSENHLLDICPFITVGVRIAHLRNRANHLVREEHRLDIQARVAAMTEQFDRIIKLREVSYLCNEAAQARRRLEDLAMLIELIDNELEARQGQIAALQVEIASHSGRQKALPHTIKETVSDLFFEAMAAKIVDRLQDIRTIGKRVLTLEQAAEYMGLTGEALRQKVLAREIPTVGLDRRLRFDIRELDALIDSKKRWAH